MLFITGCDDEITRNSDSLRGGSQTF